MRRTVNRVAKLVGRAIILGLALMIGLIWLGHQTSVELPEPSGPFAVGRIASELFDSSRVDSIAPVPAIGRAVPIWIWYPVDSQDAGGHERVRYLPSDWQVACDSVQGPIITHLLTRHLDRVSPHAVADARISSARPYYPVLLFKPGLGALSTDYTTIAEDLASHGFIEAASDARYSMTVVVLDDGEVVTSTVAGNPGHLPDVDERDRALERLLLVWSDDLAFLLDRFQSGSAEGLPSWLLERMDLGRVGAFGHSFAGAASAQFCRDEGRCRAGLNIDGAPYGDVVRTGVDKPFTTEGAVCLSTLGRPRSDG